MVLFSTFFSSFAGGFTTVVFFSMTFVSPEGAAGVTRASQAVSITRAAGIKRMCFMVVIKFRREAGGQWYPGREDSAFRFTPVSGFGGKGVC